MMRALSTESSKRSAWPPTRLIRNHLGTIGGASEDNITPLLEAGKSVLIVGHEASVYAPWQRVELGIPQ